MLKNTHCSNLSTKSTTIASRHVPLGLTNKTKKDHNRTIVYQSWPPGISHLWFWLFFMFFESWHRLPTKCIMASGQAKVLIMHRKLWKDKVLFTEQLPHSSRGLAALLEGDLIEPNEGGRDSHSHTPTYDFLTRTEEETSRDNNGLIWLTSNSQTTPRTENTGSVLGNIC